jgi:hypothetical protein
MISVDCARLLRLSSTFCAVAAFSLSNTLVAQEAKNDSTPRVWTITFKKGDAGLYRSMTTLSGVSADGKSAHLLLKPTERIEIKDVNARGEATIVDTPVAMEVSENGKTQKIEDATFTPTTQVFSKTGLLLREDGETLNSADPLTVAQSLLANLPVPTFPVKTGDSWKTEFENKLTPGKKVSMVTTFLGTEKIFGIDTVKTKFTLAVPTAPNAADGQTIKAEGVRCLDIKTGRLVRSDVKMINVEFTTSEGVVKGSMEVSSHLIVPGVNDKDKTGDTPKK